MANVSFLGPWFTVAWSSGELTRRNIRSYLIVSVHICLGVLLSAQAREVQGAINSMVSCNKLRITLLLLIYPSMITSKKIEWQKLLWKMVTNDHVNHFYPFKVDYNSIVAVIIPPIFRNYDCWPSYASLHRRSFEGLPCRNPQPANSGHIWDI